MWNAVARAEGCPATRSVHPVTREHLSGGVLVVGGTGVDTIVRVADLSIPPGDALLVPPVRDYVGHTGNGVALGFHALGVPTAMVDFVGDDVQGELIRNRYATAGLELIAVPAPLGTPRSINLVDEGGRRFAFFDGRHPSDLRMPESVLAPLVVRSAHVHVTRASHAVSAFEVAHRQDRTVSTDLQAWDGRASQTLEYAAASDIVFMSGAELRDDADVVIDRVLNVGRSALVVITLGDQGALVQQRDGQLREVAPVPTHGPPRDSNGAGDAFATAFLTTWFREGDVERAGYAGAVSGAFACEHDGTHEQLITAEELAERMARKHETR